MKKKKGRSRKPVQKKAKEPQVQWKSIILLVAVIAVVLFFVFGGPSGTESTVIATVNGDAVTQEELDTQYDRLPPQLKGSVSKQSLLKQLVDEKLLLQEAGRKGYDATKEEVDQIIDRSIQLSGLSREEFDQRLALENITQEFLEDFYQKQIIINKLLNESIISQVDISEKEIEEYYEEMKDQFQVPEQRKASHILFLVTEEQDEDTAKEKAEDIHKEATPDNFADLAKEHSEDPGSAPNGGSLGQFGKGVMVKEFEETVFSLEKDEISEPIKTPFGYHIVYLEDILPKRTAPLEEVSESIQSQLSVEKQRTMYDEFIADLREGSDIQILSYQDSSGVEGVSTFQQTGNEVCKNEDGKPIVRMYSLSTCPHCQWIRETFNKVAQEYVDAGKIVAYHYQLDTGDDELTEEKEEQVPVGESALFGQYSPKKQVPLFLMGCSYKRIGNGYERQNDLASEEAEFRAVLDAITA